MEQLDAFDQQVSEAQKYLVTEQESQSIAPAQSQPEVLVEPEGLSPTEALPETDWLDAFDAQVQEAQKTLEVPQDATQTGKTFDDWFDEKYSGTKEFLEATGESVVQLGYGAVSFLPSYGLGFATQINEKLKNLLRQDRIRQTVRQGGYPADPSAPDLARKPTAQLLEEAKIKSPKQVRELADKASGFFAEVMGEPVTPGGKKVVGKAGELMDWLFHYPHVADEKLSKAGYPNLGYLTGFAGEMLLLKGLHGAVKKGKKVSKNVISRYIKTVEDVKDIKTPAQLEVVSRQVDKILDQLGITEEQRIVATDKTFRAQKAVGSWVEERTRVRKDAELTKEVPSAEEIRTEVKAKGVEKRPEQREAERIRVRDVKEERVEAKEEIVVEKPKPEVVLEKPSVRKLNIEEQFGKRVAGEISDGIKVAEDMGVFETIRAGIEGKKKVGEIMKEVKKSRYYEEDLKDFGYVEKDLRSAVRAIKVREFGDVKIAETLKAKLEKEVVKKPKVKEPKEIIGKLPEKGKELPADKVGSKIYVGEEAQLHADIATKYNILNKPDLETGFVDSTGSFWAYAGGKKRPVKKPKPPRVDVERGRPPGVEADLKKYERPLDVKGELLEREIRREAEMAPMRTAEGKLVGSKVLAMRMAKSRGLIGEVVRTPDKKGWYVKKTREMKKVEVEATKRFWDEMLGEEGLGVIDILKEERGAITLTDRRKVRRLFKEDQELANIEARFKGKGLPPNIVRLKSLVEETEKSLAAGRFPKKNIAAVKKNLQNDKDALLAAILSLRPEIKARFTTDYLSSLVRTLKSEKGSVTLQPETIKKLRSSVKRRKVTETDIVAEMQRRKVPDSQILRAFPNAFKKTAVEDTSEFLKKGQRPEEFLARRVLKKGKAGRPGRLAPAVTRGDAHVVSTVTKDLPRPIFGEKVRTLATSEGLFTQLGKPLKEAFYYPMRKAAKAENDFVTTLVKESNRMKRTFSIGTRQKHAENIEKYSIAQQPDGLARLKNQGVKDIPKKLTSKEKAVYDEQQLVYRSLYKEINKAREAAGQQKFPAVKNYSPWFHDLARLQEFEKINILDNLGKINQAMTRLREIPSQIEKVSRAPGLAGHEKFRAGPETPGYLHLNTFDNFNAYAKLAGRAIHIGPTTAYLHELLLPRYKLAENAPNTWRFISDWLDYQKGHEPIMYVTNPVTRRRMSGLSSNVAVSYVTFNWGSFLNQASSINNTITLIGLPRTVEGFAKLMNPAEHKRASKTSDILTVRAPEVALMQAGRPYPWIPGKPGRTISDAGRQIKTYGSAPLMLNDGLIAKASWLGAEAKAKRIYKTSKTYEEMPTAKRAKAMEEFSKHYADDVVEQAQGSATRAARAPFQRTAEGAAMSTLQTFVIANFDFLSRQVLGIKNPDITNLQRVQRLTRYVASTAAIAYAFDFMGMRSPVPDPVKAAKEEAEKLGYVTDIERYTKISKAIGKEMLEYVPIYGGKFKYGSEFGGALVNELVKLGNGDATAIPRLLGIPGFQQFVKSYRAAERGGTDIDIIFGRYIEKPKKGRVRRPQRSR